MTAQYLTVTEAADLLRVNLKTIRRAIQSGRLPAIRVGTTIRINRATLDDHLAYRSDPLAPRRTTRARPAPSAGRFQQLVKPRIVSTPTDTRRSR